MYWHRRCSPWGLQYSLGQFQLRSLLLFSCHKKWAVHWDFTFLKERLFNKFTHTPKFQMRKELPLTYLKFHSRQGQNFQEAFGSKVHLKPRVDGHHHHHFRLLLLLWHSKSILKVRRSFLNNQMRVK